MDACQHNHCKKQALKAAEDVCETIGARFTAQRRRVFEIIWQSHKALTAADIMDQMDNKQPPITYRALDFLKNAGLIHHITSLNAFVGCMHAKNSEHVGQMLVCTECKDVIELMPTQAVDELVHEAESIGFQPQETHIEMLGVCQQCK